MGVGEARAHLTALIETVVTNIYNAICQLSTVKP